MHGWGPFTGASTTFHGQVPKNVQLSQVFKVNMLPTKWESSCLKLSPSKCAIDTASKYFTQVSSQVTWLFWFYPFLYKSESAHLLFYSGSVYLNSCQHSLASFNCITFWLWSSVFPSLIFYYLAYNVIFGDDPPSLPRLANTSLLLCCFMSKWKV